MKIARQPVFGPIAMVAAEGIPTHVLTDRRPASPRATRQRSKAMLQAVAQLASDIPDLVQLDINRSRGHTRK